MSYFYNFIKIYQDQRYTIGILNIPTCTFAFYFYSIVKISSSAFNFNIENINKI